MRLWGAVREKRYNLPEPGVHHTPKGCLIKYVDTARKPWEIQYSQSLRGLVSPVEVERVGCSCRGARLAVD